MMPISLRTNWPTLPSSTRRNAPHPLFSCPSLLRLRPLLLAPNLRGANPQPEPKPPPTILPPHPVTELSSRLGRPHPCPHHHHHLPPGSRYQSRANPLEFPSVPPPTTMRNDSNDAWWWRCLCTPPKS
jgi:hypothetical protein